MSDREHNHWAEFGSCFEHAPEKFGVDMDINGWVNTRNYRMQFRIQKALPFERWHFEAIANSDEKVVQVEGEMIRATYGHSIELELDY